MRVRDIMSKPVFTIPEDTTLEKAARLMLERNIGGLPVTAADRRLAGILTESDFSANPRPVPFSLLRLPSVLGHWLGPTVERVYQEARNVAARDVMSTRVITIGDDDTIEEAVRRLYEHNVRRLPVVRGTKLVGMVTQRDLLRVMLPPGGKLGLRKRCEHASVGAAYTPSRTSALVGSAPMAGDAGQPIRDIAEPDWSAFADQFSRLHKAQPVIVETYSPDRGKQLNARSLSLMGIAVEPDPTGGSRIEILLGDSPDAHMAHTLDHPSRLRVAEWNDGVSAALQLESADGQVTLVRVGPAEQTLPPGFVTDDILHWPSARRTAPDRHFTAD